MLRRLPRRNALRSFEAAARHERSTHAAEEDADMAVSKGSGNWPGLHVERLCAEQLFRVCSPKLLAGGHGLTKPADVLKFPLLHLDDGTAWPRWLGAVGVGGVETVHGPVFNRASMLIDAAIDGQGVALARTALAASDLINGRLVKPFAAALRLSKVYWIACPQATSSIPK